MTENKFCEHCGTRLDEAKLQRVGARGMRFCNRRCSTDFRLARGDYQRLAALGNTAQAEFKKIHGKAPGVRGGARRTAKNREG